VKRTLPGGLELDDDRSRVDVGALHRYLSEESYWARERPLDTVERLVREASRVVGVYDADRLVGFCRVVTDGTAFAWLADVYVLGGYRGRGLGVELVREAIDGGAFRDLPWYLNTVDAQGLYAKLGFGPPDATRMMYRPRPGA
jgi:GNAT superfamily N-acetyltransferase